MSVRPEIRNVLEDFPIRSRPKPTQRRPDPEVFLSATQLPMRDRLELIEEALVAVDLELPQRIVAEHF